MDAYRQGLALAARGAHAEAIGCFEQALACAPEDPRVLFALGNTARSLDMPGPAEHFFRRVLQTEPHRIEAVVNLANLLRAQGRFEAVQALLAPALQHAPQSPELWLSLGTMHRETGADNEAGHCFARALSLKPDFVPTLVNRADLLADGGDVAGALTLYDRALKLCNDPQARLNRAILHLLQGNLSRGWRDYEARLKLKGKAPVPDHGLKRWDGTFRKALVLLVTAEQGIGDQIMFASLIPELARRARVILECDPRLVSLFQRSFPSVAVRPSDARTIGGVARTSFGWLKTLGGASAAIEIGSLPKFLRHDVEQFPDPHAYLVAAAEETARWHQAFGPGPAIGVCWRSAKLGGGRSLQFAPLAAWAELVRGIAATVVCAQYDATREELSALEALSGRQIVVPPGLDQKNELDRTCAMLGALDVVVSAPTAVSWLAAAAGVATHKVVRDTSWTAFGRAVEPFAPACAIVAPKQRGDWTDAFRQVLPMLGASGVRSA